MPTKRSLTLPIPDDGPSSRQKAARQLREQLDEAIRMLDIDDAYNRNLIECARRGDASGLARLLHDGPVPLPHTMTYGLYVSRPRLAERPIPKRLRPDLDGLLSDMCGGIVEAGPRCFSLIPGHYIETLHVLISAGCRDRTINGLPLHEAIVKAWGDVQRCGAVDRLLMFIERWTDGPIERERLSARDGARLLGIDFMRLRYLIKKNRSRLSIETVNRRNTYLRSDLESLVADRSIETKRDQAFDELVRGTTKNLRALIRAYERARARRD